MSTCLRSLHLRTEEFVVQESQPELPTVNAVRGRRDPPLTRTPGTVQGIIESASEGSWFA